MADNSTFAFIAANRFGYGAKPGELSSIAPDPMGWLLGQLDPRYAASPALAGLPSTQKTLSDVHDIMQAGKDMKKQGDDPEKAREAKKAGNQELKQDYIQDSADRIRAVLSSPAPFFERLVQFWDNHFSISILKGKCLPFVSAFERDAIRPNVLGRFEDMLIASSRHPGMILYLDNEKSAGPNSPAGRRRGMGLNENLAREIMELHTVGVDGGYTQDDVISFAKILTGWTVDAQARGDGSGFFFLPQLHEPGPKVLLGRQYAENGVGEGEMALRNLAWHPTTAQFIATKLARHFIADDPPPSAVTKLANAFAQSRGNLMDVYRTLIALPEVWQQPLPKVKTPNDYLLSIFRATGADLEDKKMIGAFRMLDQVPFSAASPAGWSDQAKDWIGAEALLRRIDVSRMLARGVGRDITPQMIMDQTIGPVASPETQFAVAHAGSPQEAITLLFASPEFQRR